jgi:glycosyltransferase involved in cell wall biosynthesis
VTPTVHILTGEYPPECGGVGDYTRLVAEALATRGFVVHVWCPTVDDTVTNRLSLHRLPDVFGVGSRRILESAVRAQPGAMLLQYVPNALGARGANLRFCVWLRRQSRDGADVRVMFHEPYYYFSWRSPAGNLLALLQRAMAAALLHAAVVVYLSTETWVRYLRPLAPHRTRFIVSPIPSTIPWDVDPREVLAWRARHEGPDGDSAVVGHFGSCGDHVARQLVGAVPVILSSNSKARFICMGRGSDAFAETLCRQHPSLAGRISGTGTLPRRDIAAALRACDVAVQPYPDGVTTRRTSVMAALANGVATVSTAGALTEPVWHETGAVALAPASDPNAIGAAVSALLRDRTARAALAAAGRAAYDDHFAIGRTMAALLEGPAVGA